MGNNYTNTTPINTTEDNVNDNNHPETTALLNRIAALEQHMGETQQKLEWLKYMLKIDGDGE
jgi:hypothetical protein